MASSHAIIATRDAIVSQLHDAYNDAINGTAIKNGLPRNAPNTYQYIGTAMNRMMKKNIMHHIKNSLRELRN
jgi:hypothetical protein